jgi:hypothetical protein
MIGETQTLGRGRGNSNSTGRGTGRSGRGRGNGGRNILGGRGHGGHGRGGRGRGRGKGDDSTLTYIPPAEWNAMTAQQRQTFLQARAASRISSLTSIVTPPDDVSAITTPTGIQVPTQVAQVQQVYQGNTAQGQNQGPAGSVASGPFAGRAAHRG